LKYPKKSIEADFSGTVYIEFIIEIDGTITNLKVTKSLSILLDREVLRVITKIPKWKPGKQHNRLVRTLYVIPISFGLD
jgi:TonB family protein